MIFNASLQHYNSDALDAEDKCSIEMAQVLIIFSSLKGSS